MKKISSTFPAQNTVQGWFDMTSGFTEESPKTRTGIPMIYGLDVVHEHNNVMNATIFPHNIGLGAIAANNLQREMDAAFTAGRVTAQEILATGGRMTTVLSNRKTTRSSVNISATTVLRGWKNRPSLPPSTGRWLPCLISSCRPKNSKAKPESVPEKSGV